MGDEPAREFDSRIKFSAFRDIASRVNFLSFEPLVQDYEYAIATGDAEFRWQGSAAVPVAVRNVSLRTFSRLSARHDAGRRGRDARAPHFTRELEVLANGHHSS